jgi:hypothetical protein
MKFQTVWNLIWANSEYFERQTEQASSCYQLYALPAERAAEGESHAHMVTPSKQT